MADFDANSFFGNPLLQIGLSLLGSNNNQPIGQSIGQGLQNAQAAQIGPIVAKIKQLQADQAERAANFNPIDYLQTTPNPVGTNSNLRSAQLIPQMPAALGGIAGGPMPSADPTQMALTPQPGTPNGSIDLAGLLSGGLRAGQSPAELLQIAGLLDPEIANRLKGPMTVGPGQVVIGPNGQELYRNELSPPGGIDSQIRNLVTLRDAAKARGDTANATLYDNAIQKVSGGFDQDFKTQQLADLNQQRETNNAFRQQQQEQQQAQRDQQNQFKVQNQAMQFGNAMEKSGIPQAQAALDTIDSILSKYPEGKVPGYGRAEGLLPDFLTSQDGQQLRQAVATLANVQLKQRSGAAVTDQEMRRFKQELGTGTAVPEDRLRQGIQQMRNLIEANKRNYAASAPQDVIDQYEANGGMQLNYLRKSQGPDATPAKPIAPFSDLQAEARKRGLIK